MSIDFLNRILCPRLVKSLSHSHKLRFSFDQQNHHSHAGNGMSTNRILLDREKVVAFFFSLSNTVLTNV